MLKGAFLSTFFYSLPQNIDVYRFLTSQTECCHYFNPAIAACSHMFLFHLIQLIPLRAMRYEVYLIIYMRTPMAQQDTGDRVPHVLFSAKQVSFKKGYKQLFILSLVHATL